MLLRLGKIQTARRKKNEGERNGSYIFVCRKINGEEVLKNEDINEMKSAARMMGGETEESAVAMQGHQVAAGAHGVLASCQLLPSYLLRCSRTLFGVVHSSLLAEVLRGLSLTQGRVFMERVCGVWCYATPRK